MTREFRPPELYNAAADLIERNLRGGRGGNIAVIDDRGSYSYAELAGRVHRCANALRRSGTRGRTAHRAVLI